MPNVNEDVDPEYDAEAASTYPTFPVAEAVIEIPAKLRVAVCPADNTLRSAAASPLVPEVLESDPVALTLPEIAVTLVLVCDPSARLNEAATGVSFREALFRRYSRRSCEYRW